jgi:hypothetical protein
MQDDYMSSEAHNRVPMYVRLFFPRKGKDTPESLDRGVMAAVSGERVLPHTEVLISISTGHATEDAIL